MFENSKIYPVLKELDLDSLGGIASKKLSEVTVMELLVVMSGFIVEKEEVPTNSEPEEAQEEKPIKLSVRKFLEPIGAGRIQTRLYRAICSYYGSCIDENGLLDLYALNRSMFEEKPYFINGIGRKSIDCLRQLFNEHGIDFLI